MSRCFPFPPPGYEAKPRSEHKDLLIKAKHKEKKHKKERKHRERKEKDRDHRKDKHNKKHEREIHKHRRKDKGRGEDKKRKLEQQSQKNGDVGNRRPKERMLNELVKVIKPTDDLVTQTLGQEEHANCTGSSKLLPRSNRSFGSADYKEKERTLSRAVEKSGRTTQHNHANYKGKDTGHRSKTGILNGKGLQVVSADNHSTRSHNSNGVNLQQERCVAQRNLEGVANTTIIPGGERGLNGRITPSPIALQRTKQVDQQLESSPHSAFWETDCMGTKGAMEKENESAKADSWIDQQSVRGKNGRVLEKAKAKGVKVNHHKGVNGGNRDHDVKEKTAKGKNKDKEKERKGDLNEQKTQELDERGTNKNNIDPPLDLSHLNAKNITSDDVKKRKDLEANGFLHEHGMRMTKLPRMSPATNTCKSDWLEDIKEHNYNDASNEVSLKPPHPDTKYLSRMYSIPASDDSPGYIDDDWLFSGDRVDQRTAMSEIIQAPKVWDEAQLIGAADIVALPYVIPL